MKNKLNQEIKLPSKKKEMDHHDSQSYWKTRIIECIHRFTFLNTTEHNADNIETKTQLLPLLLKVFTIFNMCLCYDNEFFKENMVNNIGIRCSNCGRTTGLYMKYTNYKYMVTKFVLNSVLQHVGLSQIIETNKKVDYYI